MTEEAQWADETRNELKRLVTVGHIRRMSLTDRQAEVRQLVLKKLEPVPPKKWPSCLAALARLYPHWQFLQFLRQQPKRDPLWEEALEALVQHVPGLDEAQRATVATRLAEAGVGALKEKTIVPPDDFCRKLGLPPGTKLDPTNVFGLLLGALDQLRETYSTTAEAHNRAMPDKEPDFREAPLAELAAQALTGEPQEQDLTARIKKFRSPCNAARVFLRAAVESAPLVFVEQFPRLVPALIQHQARREGKTPWEIFERIAEKWPPEKIRDLFRNSIYSAYKKSVKP